MIYLKVLLVFCSIILLSSCSNEEEISSEILQQFADVLLYENHKGGSTNAFFDYGSWFGFSHFTEDRIGLDGPYILSDSNGFWYKQKLLSPSIEIFGEAPQILEKINYSFPGSIGQKSKLRVSNVQLDMDIKLIFANSNMAIASVSFRNNEQKDIDLKIQWNNSEQSFKNEIGAYQYPLRNGNLFIIPENINQKNANGRSTELLLSAQSTEVLYVKVIHKPGEQEFDEDVGFTDIKSHFEKNAARWSQYLKNVGQIQEDHKILYAKCIYTLVNNWRSPAGELKHDGLYPSYAYRGFHGFWSWDSWKHAVAIANFAPELAKNQIRAMYDFQDDRGMIADCIFRDTTIERHNWRDTKPPLSGWSIYQVVQKTGDIAFAKEMFPKLIKYHNWWYKDRDHNQNGLCEFGSTDGSRVAAGWESGMDNAVRFDSSEMVKVNEQAWSFNQESVDLNAYLYAEKIFISKIADLIGEVAHRDDFSDQANQLLPILQNYFYESSLGYFFDVNTISGDHIKRFGPEAWTMLWTGAATKKQAEKIVNVIMDTSHFNTLVPFPTLSVSDSSFNPKRGYWRGPVWIDQAYFAIRGMEKYGYTDEAEALKNKLINNAIGLLESNVSIRENYHPLTGEGLNANHFSWSAAHYMLLLL